MKNMWLQRICLMAVAVLSFSCEKEEPIEEETTYDNGFFIINEGNFGGGNASLSFFDTDESKVSNNVFNGVNDIFLGDQGQDLFVYKDNLIITVQASAKVIIANATTGKQESIFTEATSPRFALQADDNTLYVSDWGDAFSPGTVHVVNTSDMSVTKSITVGVGPGKMLLDSTSLYVVNYGGYTVDSTVSVIDVSTNTVSKTIETGMKPNSLVLDKNGDLWVACNGNSKYNADYTEIDTAASTEATLHRYSNDLEQDQLSFQFWGLGSLTTNGSMDELHFLYKSQVYDMSVSASSVPTSPLVSGSFYGLAVNPDNDKVITLDADDWSGAGTMSLYSTNGVLESSYDLGVGPSVVAFK
jgi:YVTN family beta-propeller protein